MKLYYAPGACSLAVHIALEWIGAPYEAQVVKPGSPEILKVNPLGAVPALDTGEGWILTQAAAILRHLARVHPQARLAGDEAPDHAACERSRSNAEKVIDSGESERALGEKPVPTFSQRALRDEAELDRWLAFITGDLHPAFFPVFMPQRYTTETGDDSVRAVRDAGLALVRKRFAIMEAHLKERAFFLGDARSILDAYAFPMARWGAATLPEGLADFPAIRAHHEKIARDEGVRRALAAEGLT